MIELIGRDVGPYRVVSVLGRGGMGVVYRAEDPRLGREVAIKVLPEEVAENPRRLRRFEREARAVGALNHPNILTVHEVGSHDGRPYIVTELLEGETLFELIGAGGLTVRKALEFAGQIAAGLSEAHDKGVVHRDIKPANLFLTKHGHVKILDFGLAKLRESVPVSTPDAELPTQDLSATDRHEVIGTVQYMSPEQARGRTLDHLTDIFSLGVVIYEMITGARPFEGETYADTTAAILKEEPKPVANFIVNAAPVAQRLLDRCLEKRPEHRFQSAGELRAAIDSALAGFDSGERAAPPSRATGSAPSSPAFLEQGAPEPETPVFVAREAELERLGGMLDAALAGRGSVVFVTGEAGSGKTALIGEWVRRAQTAHPDLVVATGACNAATGAGDAYGPWRQVLAQLTGDVEARVASGAMTAEQGRRLWALAPAVAEAIVGSGRDLVDTLVSGAGVLQRAEAAAVEETGWIGPLRELVERKASLPPDVGLQQSAVFMQCSRVVRAAAHSRPLLIALEDLHWVDAGSVGMLFQIARELNGSRLLIVGSYRPEEVALGRGGEPHPLAPIVTELRRVHGDMTVAVGTTKDRGFVDALIDSEPNVLDTEFRHEFYGRTQGHALFTVELLRTLQDREMLVRDDEGRWAPGENLDWQALPARIEGVIGARVDRLADELKELLTIASVEGAEFTAEVLARVREADTRKTIRRLSGELDRQHRLVTARGIKALAEGRLSLYGFSHVLFQRYLYNNLDEVERTQLHQDVGEVLEALYGDGAGEIAPQLARHFSEAGIVDKAIHYLQEAGRQAVQRAANVEAIGHLRHALDLVLARPEGPLRDRLELALQIQLYAPLTAICGWAAEEVGRVAKRAHELSARVTEPELVGTAMWTLGGYYNCRAEYEMASEIARQTAVLADQSGDADLSVIAKWMRGFSTYFRGDLEGARLLFEEIVSHECTEDSSLAFVMGLDPRATGLVHLSIILCYLGYLDESRRRFVEAQNRARRIDHPVSESCVYWSGWPLEVLRGDFPAAMRHSAQLKKLAMDHGMQVQLLLAQLYQAVEEALGQTSEAAKGTGLLAQLDATGYHTSRSLCQSYVALEHMALGQVSEALAVFDDALECAESLDEQLHVPAILISKAQLLVDTGSSAQAEDCLQQAINVSRDQHARFGELLSATELARLWQAQGKRREAVELLRPVYDWFTEGFDTLPLIEARELLNELERPVFVAREAELERLGGMLNAALAGQGSVAFVTGEAGTGKTALIGEWVRRAQTSHPDLVVAVGACNAATGAGDPYGPWRQVLAQLTGDVEARVASGAMTAEQGRRLWALAPAVAEAMVESGSDLVETLVPGAALLKRAEVIASEESDSIRPLRELVQRKMSLPPDVSLQQAAVFMQCSRVLRTTARSTPLMVVLEDLHWVDAGSVGMLFQIARELGGSRLLIVGCYRPEEVALGRGGEPHPLAPVVTELQREHGDITVPVGESEGTGFVDALIDSEPNDLDADFRQALVGRTEGHALFTVELLRTLQDRGMLVQDANDRWVVAEDLDWQALPARIEGVIGARVDRLADELKELLTIASVEGAEFTAEVLARVREADTRKTIRRLSGELDRQHRLVTARGIKALAEGRLSLYGFSHVLFQRYLYNNLDEVERTQLHQDVGEVLEALYGDEAGEIAPQLARHFSEAGIVDKAIHYLQEAGRQAVQRAANVEAIGHLRHALDLVLARPEGPLRDRLELALQIQLTTPLIATCGWAAEEVGRAAKRAHELSARVTEPELVGSAMVPLASYYNCRAEYEMASEIARQAAVLADQSGDAVLSALANWGLGFSTYFRGDLEGARPLFEEIVSHECTESSSLAFVIGLDPRVTGLIHLSVILQILGYLDESRRRFVEAQDRARRIDHPVSESCVYWSGWMHEVMRGDFPAAMRHSAQLKKLAMDHGMQVQLLLAQLFQAVEEALGQTSEAAKGPGLLAQLDATGYRTSRSFHQMYVALENMALGQVPEALAVFDDALECAESLDEQLHVPPILISKAQLLVDIGSSAQAEDCLQKAINVSRDQHARFGELRSATLLAGLWQAEGKRDEARELLQPIYDWFTEGLDTVPLVEARKLLDELVEAQNE